ncbi:sensor histidine kinase [Bittarella massiliensis (ex Durand et al. 2017)]|uniref:DUF4118 domain-containing protein n=1 Tax=Bittarella massiliensis (ex Durand et al. 2017) TaxID=1720313 RepID=UPI001AA17219|nr:sensor histidine kinase KdpD [Bittarella massiliensis (ex Durand et al. 2017)]MBO1679635.1 sensor histidine kinase KdpD [Bittarella massiliensis (ex Durand et al. 2017)]
MEETRRDPEDFLRQIRREERAKQRGRLKIFFGYAAGVGKTYAMLKAAQAARRRGIDVLAGYVEPHARPDTTALLEGLEQLPPLEVEHRGIALREFDLDAALARHPQLILVDELAHTNAECCRHQKRYQDVDELLGAGIDVYTTVNVQHIESLYDTVAAITGVTVRERIPDRVFDGADQVELVDIEPQELMERLQAGKIYREEQAQRALGHFFDEKNLTALREIALRRCADRINRLAERVRLAEESGYCTDEHILVCLSPSPSNAKCIRTAARMAGAFKGNLTALFVETPDFPGLGVQDRAQLRENIHLAGQLGASVETVYGEDVPYQIAEFARVSGVSKIVIGRSSTRRKYPWRGPNLTDRLIAAAPNLDIHIIPDDSAGYYRARRVRQRSADKVGPDLLKSAALLAGATGVGFLFKGLGFTEANIITVYILGVLLTAVITKKRVYSLASSAVSVLTFNYFFTAPRYTLAAYDRGYPATFAIMFIAAFLTSTLAGRLKQQARRSVETAYRTKTLLETNQLLQRCDSREAIVGTVAGQLVKLLRRDVVFYPARDGGVGEPLSFPAQGGAPRAELTAENERAVAAWVFQNNKRAGASTGTLGSAKCLYLAVRVNEVVYGVAGIALDGEPLDAYENSIMLSILGECALALESENAIREREAAAVLAKNEQLRANLLRSISHDLRTPLTSISGSAGVLLESEKNLDEGQRRQLYSDIYEDSLWLINLVENLLSVTKIEDGTMRLNPTAELVEEVVGEALRHVSRKRAEHHIQTHFPDEFLLAKMDARLIVQVLINLVDNAIKYTPVGSTIAVSAVRKGRWAVISVADDGGGIPDSAKERIFDMFYTVNSGVADSRRSMGLGLALCKSIVTAHGGEIAVADNAPHGTVFSFTLPIEEVTLHEQ